jgi:predicted metal-dependent peptidase
MDYPLANAKMLARRKTFCARYPFLGSHALRLTLVEDLTVATGYTDAKVIGYNPHFVDQLTGPQVDMLFAHEVMHVVLNHPWRRGSRDHTIWNVAGDHVINLILLAEGFTLIDGVLANPDYADRSTEWVYGQEYREAQNPDSGEQESDQPSDQGDQGDQPSDQGKPSDQPGGDQGGEPGDQGGDPGDSQGGDVGGDQPGSSSSTPKEYGPDDVPTFEQAMESGDLGKVRDCVNGDGAIDRDAESANNQAVTMTSAMDRERGTMSGALAEQINGRLESVVDWTDALDSFFQNVGSEYDVTWAKPNKRFIARGDYFPAMVREGLEHLALVVDSSLSMSINEIRQSISETLTIAEQYECRVTFMACSNDIGPVQTWEYGDYPEDASTVEIGKRGGTSFKPPFEYIEDMDDQPDALVYFTDGAAPFPDAPDYPVLWAVIPDRHGDCVEVPFGEQIEVQMI